MGDWRCKRKNISSSFVPSFVPDPSFIITESHEKNMEAANASAQALRNQILATETELHKLRQELAQVEVSAACPGLQDLSLSDGPGALQNGNQWPLSEEEYKRYGRQMIVPSIGMQGL